jgi:uncharacterized protein (TIGR00251 family)
MVGRSPAGTDPSIATPLRDRRAGQGCDDEQVATWWTAIDGGVRLTVHVSPGTRRSEVVGVAGDALRVRVAAPPAEGKANRELAKVLAARLGVRPGAVTIVRGDAGRHKVVEVRAGPEGSAELVTRVEAL